MVSGDVRRRDPPHDLASPIQIAHIVCDIFHPRDFRADQFFYSNSFLFVVFCYAAQGILLKGPGQAIDGIIPTLPLIIVSGAFLASLFLSLWGNVTHEAGDGEQDVAI